MNKEMKRREEVEDDLLMVDNANGSMMESNKQKMKAPIGWRSLFVCNELNELQMY